eukprot:ANDGO_01883.mRNA.1 hypothetical protein
MECTDERLSDICNVLIGNITWPCSTEYVDLASRMIQHDTGNETYAVLLGIARLDAIFEAASENSLDSISYEYVAVEKGKLMKEFSAFKGTLPKICEMIESYTPELKAPVIKAQITSLKKTFDSNLQEVADNWGSEIVNAKQGKLMVHRILRDLAYALWGNIIYFTLQSIYSTTTKAWIPYENLQSGVTQMQFSRRIGPEEKALIMNHPFASGLHEAELAFGLQYLKTHNYLNSVDPVLLPRDRF